MSALSPALEKCKLNIFSALEVGGNETPALLRSSIKLLQADNILDFLVEGNFDAAIGDEFSSSREAEISLANTIKALPLWMTDANVDRRNMKFTTSLRFPLEGPLAVTAATREKAFARESAALAAAMTHAPEVGMKLLSSFTKTAVQPWIPTLHAYYDAGGSRAVVNLLTPDCKDQIIQAIISTENPVLREFSTIDEREVVYVVFNHFKLTKASDLTVLEAAWHSIRMKHSTEFDADDLALYLGKVHRLLLDHASDLSSYSVKQIIELMVKHLSPKELVAAARPKIDTFKSPAAGVAGIRDLGKLFEDHANVQRLFTPSKMPHVIPAPAFLYADKKEQSRTDPDIERLKENYRTKELTLRREIASLHKAAAAAVTAPAVVDPVPVFKSSECANCLRSKHTVKSCTSWCYHPQCFGKDKHTAKSCSRWLDKQAAAIVYTTSLDYDDDDDDSDGI